MSFTLCFILSTVKINRPQLIHTAHGGLITYVHNDFAYKTIIYALQMNRICLKVFFCRTMEKRKYI